MVYVCRDVCREGINNFTLSMEYKQIKPKWYYVFWALATASVIGGQIYIANSYRYLAELLKLSLS